MQEGGLPVFHGTSRYKRGEGGMFGMLAKSARSILPRVEKKFQSVVPVLLNEGKKLLTRKKSVKQAVKSAAKCSKSNAINTGKEALRQEIARYQKGGGINKYQYKKNRKSEKKIKKICAERLKLKF